MPIRQPEGARVLTTKMDLERPNLLAWQELSRSQDGYEHCEPKGASMGRVHQRCKSLSSHSRWLLTAA
jgi:hypothetical protein